MRGVGRLSAILLRLPQGREIAKIPRPRHRNLAVVSYLARQRSEKKDAATFLNVCLSGCHFPQWLCVFIGHQCIGGVTSLIPTAFYPFSVTPFDLSHETMTLLWFVGGPLPCHWFNPGALDSAHPPA